MWNVWKEGSTTRETQHICSCPSYILICREHSTIFLLYFISFFFQSHNIFYWQLTNQHARFVASEIDEFNGMFYRRIVPRIVVFSIWSRFLGKIFPRDSLSALCDLHIKYCFHFPFVTGSFVSSCYSFSFLDENDQVFRTQYYESISLSFITLKISRNFLSLTETSQWQRRRDKW